MTTRKLLLVPLALSFASTAGCADEVGDYEVRVRAENAVLDGVSADGWDITFDEFVVVLGDVAVAGPDVSGGYNGAFVFDLSSPPEDADHLLGTMALIEGTYETLDYHVAPNADAAAVSIGDYMSATEDQVEVMKDGGYSIYLAGSATKNDQTITFAWGFTSDTTYTNCEAGGPIARNAAVETNLTIRGTRLFLDALGSENASRTFDAIAAADANMDGEVTMAELTAVELSGLTGYDTGGDTEITSLWGFLRAQTQTFGFVRGDVPCEATPA